MANLITPMFVISYPFITKPDDQGKFRLSMLFPKATSLKEMELAVQTAWKDKYPSKPQPKAGYSWPFVDAQSKPTYADIERLAGYTAVNAKTDKRPGVVDAQKNVIPLESLSDYVYAGAIFRASVSPFAYSTNGNTGVAFGLNHLQFVRHGERLDNRKSALDTFDALPLDEADEGVDLFGDN
jgi:hypothetical protein